MIRAMMRKQILMVGIVTTLLCYGKVEAECSYSYPTYFNNTYYPSYTYYTPTYNYCAPSYEPYHYDCSGWWRGRWYPAGWYQWRDNCYYLRGHGACYGYNSPSGYYGHSYCEPIAVSQFAAVLSVPIPTYYSTYIAPPEYPERNIAGGSVRTQVGSGISGSVGTQRAYQQATQQSVQTAQSTQVAVAQSVQQPSASVVQQSQVSNSSELLQVITAIKTLDGNILKLNDRVKRLESSPTQGEQESSVPAVPANEQRGIPNPQPPINPVQNPTPAPAPTPSNRTAANILTEHCAECHTEGKLYQGKDRNGKERSTSFALLKSPGVLTELDTRMQGRILTMCYERKMPPQDIEGNHSTLNDEEMDILVRELGKMMKESKLPVPITIEQPKPLQDSILPIRRNYANSLSTPTVQGNPIRRRGGRDTVVGR